MQAYTVSSPPCLSVLVHVHQCNPSHPYGSHYNPGCPSHIMPVTKTITSDHPWLSMDHQYESNLCQSIHACHCNHDNPWLSRDCQYESNLCQSIHVSHCNHDNPLLSRDCQYESNLCQSIYFCHCNYDNPWLSRDNLYEILSQYPRLSLLSWLSSQLHGHR